jgi:MOSC domain-containing protein YiiM
MTVVAIHVGPVRGGPLNAVDSVRAVAGRGLEGDRHFGRGLTLIEDEVVEELGLASGATRRQLTVRGIRLDDLVGEQFRVGEVECLGLEISEPCLHLQEMTRPGLIKDLVHRGGLSAVVITSGTIAVGDDVKFA